MKQSVNILAITFALFVSPAHASTKQRLATSEKSEVQQKEKQQNSDQAFQCIALSVSATVATIAAATGVGLMAAAKDKPDLPKGSRIDPGMLQVGMLLGGTALMILGTAAGGVLSPLAAQQCK